MCTVLSAAKIAYYYVRVLTQYFSSSLLYFNRVRSEDVCVLDEAKVSHFICDRRGALDQSRIGAVEKAVVVKSAFEQKAEIGLGAIVPDNCCVQ